MKSVIILGSARNDGETRRVVDELVRISGWEVIDLLEYEINHFDYDHANQSDDFLPLIKSLVEQFDVIVFATPVYWYSMSGIMKVFFDRITDLLRIEKETGRMLRGKHMAVVSCSNGDNLGDAFWLPFKKSAEYLGMHYAAELHTYQGKFDGQAIEAFRNQVVSGFANN